MVTSMKLVVLSRWPVIEPLVRSCMLWIRLAGRAFLAHGNRESIGVQVLRDQGSEQRRRHLRTRNALLEHLRVEGGEIGHAQSRPAASRRLGVRLSTSVGKVQRE